jgi:hypothetical protein
MLRHLDKPINRRYRIPKGNQKWISQRKRQHDKQNKTIIQYVLDTTMRKQTQITGKYDMNPL